MPWARRERFAPVDVPTPRIAQTARLVNAAMSSTRGAISPSNLFDSVDKSIAVNIVIERQDLTDAGQIVKVLTNFTLCAHVPRSPIQFGTRQLSTFTHQ